MSEPATMAWLASHELRLGWRDLTSLVTAGGRRRRNAIIAIVVFVVAMHAFANWVVKNYATIDIGADPVTLITISSTLLLSWALLLSQAMESVTRIFYTRSDLDLILTSPVSARKVFAVRMARIAAAAAMMALLLASPFINTLAWHGGPRWLAGYGVVAAMAATATAFALALTIALFRLIGARRTRLIAQIVAAVIGAGFVIGLQILAIFSGGTLSRVTALHSPWLVARLPDADSVVWWPARAALGDITALVAVLVTALLVIAGAIALFSARFGEHALAAAGVSAAAVRQRRTSLRLRPRTPSSALRRKEWLLLWRDPWLVSQTLMQILYLLPPAVLLYVTFRHGTNAYVVLIPVMVMAAGQLAGGLAWLSISGEDAPDLIATAPVTPARVLTAKIEAVLGAVALVFAPLTAVLAFESVYAALVLALGIAAATAAATFIQICFRAQARRSHFRRRHTSSRIATFAEAFSSVSWAATAAVAAGPSWLAVIPMAVALAILLGIWLVRPRTA
ncbi:MAG: permease [Proteobacteria bacterium]|nr:permease [Pseudomonadota bacterium]